MATLLDHAALRWLGLALCATILYNLYTRIALHAKRRAYSKPPFTPAIPWWDPLGITFVRGLQKAQDEHRFPEFMGEIETATYQKFGRRTLTLGTSILGREGVTTRDPVNVKALLTDLASFGLGSDRINSFKPMLGVGIFASDGKSWEHSRAMLRPNFTREQVGDLDLEERHCRDLFDAIPTPAKDGWTQEFDLQPFFYRLTMDSSTEFFFGESSYSLRASADSPEMRFVDAFDRGQHYVGKRTSMGEYYWLLNSAQFKADCKIVHEWTDKRVRRALERHSLKTKSGEREKEKYIFLDELIDQTQDPLELRSQLLNVLIAGRDTTAGLLSWVFYIFARRPEYYKQLRAVILETFGTFDQPREISFTSLKACKPLQNLMKEALRLYPGVPFNIRQALKDTALPTGGGSDGDQPIFVPKGAQIFYSVYLMHRDKAIWGENADEFVPDRWNTARPGWEYLPFNGGPRICLGQQFSLTSAGYCIVRMLQQFDQITTTDTREPKVHVALTGQSANGVHLRLHRAA